MIDSTTRLLAVIAFALSVATSIGLSDTTHKVGKGETLTVIAQRYGVTVYSIKAANKIKNANKISVGQVLKIANPKKGLQSSAETYVKYTIRKGESLSSIGIRYGVTAKRLAEINAISNVNRIRAGQKIRVPSTPGRAAPATPRLAANTMAALDRIKVNSRNWKYIVLHHTATGKDSVTNIDRVHRRQGMENGLAYHFVIGNGRGMGDGEVFIGERWKRQIQGGHLKSHNLNQVAIGICLIGNFEKTNPTRAQLEKLEALVSYLLKTTNVKVANITSHKVIHPNHTLCPGKRFPMASFKAKFR